MGNFTFRMTEDDDRLTLALRARIEQSTGKRTSIAEVLRLGMAALDERTKEKPVDTRERTTG